MLIWFQTLLQNMFCIWKVFWFFFAVHMKKRVESKLQRLT